jgi:uncharacterized protein (DUF362 family)
MMPAYTAGVCIDCTIRLTEITVGNVKHRVIIRKCDDYNPDKIAGIVKEGMEELGATPRGKTLLKPNCVVAHPEIFPYAYTRPEFLDGIFGAVRRLGSHVTELSAGERSGITLPTRWCFKNAGYPEVVKKHKAKTYYFDETRQVPFNLTHEKRLRDLIFVPKPITDCDFMINVPKFKAHPWTRLTLSLKNYIGIQDDRHRLVDHNCFLEHKIADLQEVIQPGFIAVDAITAGQKMMLTPTPYHMGAIIMGVNQCAVDTVGCCAVGVEPADLIHLRLTSERGYGPMDINEIDVTGDFPLEDLRAANEGFELCMEHIDDYFRDSDKITCTVGAFPEEHSRDYCWGGCPGALQEAMHIFKGFDPDIEDRMSKIHYVVGAVEGPLKLQDGERIIFAGDCCRWEGSINGQAVKIDGDYKKTHEVSTLRTKTNDMILKIIGPVLHCFRNRSRPFIHAKGCPVSVGSHVTYVSSFAKIPNVNFDRRNIFSVNIAYWHMRAKRFLSRLFG